MSVWLEDSHPFDSPNWHCSPRQILKSADSARCFWVLVCLNEHLTSKHTSTHTLNCQVSPRLHIWRVSVACFTSIKSFVGSFHVCDPKIAVLNVASQSNFQCIDWSSILRPLIDNVVWLSMCGAFPKQSVGFYDCLVAKLIVPKSGLLECNHIFWNGNNFFVIDVTFLFDAWLKVSAISLSNKQVFFASR